MNTIMSAELKKRTFTDTVITCILCGAALVMAVWQFVTYLSGRGIPEYLTNAAYSFMIFTELGLLSMILLEIRRTGVPFSKKIILKLRIMAVVMMAGGIVPRCQQIGADDTSMAVSVTFDSVNMLLIVLSVVVGIISEVFVYGLKLQQDNDSIA